MFGIKQEKIFRIYLSILFQIMSKEEIKNSKRKLNNNDEQDEDEEDKWMKLSKEEIIQRCKQLEKHVQQLKNSITKTKDKKPNKINRPFDFTKHSKRHIFLKFFYLGWEYQGFVVQETTTQTVEDFLFDALIKTRLIEQRTTSNYHRCGRTDKG